MAEHSWLTLGPVTLALALGSGAMAACSSRPTGQAASASGHSSLAGGQLDRAAPPEDGQWLMPAKDYQNRRYSGLTEINTGNVAGLKVAWTFATGIARGHEAGPLVVGDTMYVVTPYPNHLHALDLRKSGQKKWTYQPLPSPAAQGVACCDVVNRGASFSDGKIFFNTLDAHTIAVDAASGKELWKTKVGEINLGETVTMAPLVVKGKVLVGNSGGELGVRGWLTALDAGTGAVAWRAYSTGSDQDCLIGDEFKPHYPQDRGKDLGIHTWPPDRWKVGGGTVWGFLSYDPEADLLYYGTANPGVWNPEMRPGDNKWSAGIFARRPGSGQAVWYYQWSPHDLFDHDGVNENVLLDLTLQGQTRKVLVHADRNGFFYVVDRLTGEVLSAEPFAHVNAAKGVDLKTGRLIPVEEKKPQMGRVTRQICPAAPGAKDWQPMAFSPRTGLVYIPHNNLCYDLEPTDANYIAGTPYVGANSRFYAGPGGNRGEFCAWDPVSAKKLWAIQERFPAWSGALATAGDVVFYGNMEGWFKAVHARTGQLLWQFRTGSGIIGQPIAYRGPDGKQYIAVFSGVGGWAGAIVAGQLDPRDETAALGFAFANKDLPQHTTAGGTLYVFSL
jgi:PQQ-dependent dehydrogenase (methanol/ethanol family)